MNPDKTKAGQPVFHLTRDSNATPLKKIHEEREREE